MELSRLKEFLEITPSKLITEKKKSDVAFDGIKSIVEDALGDLGDKLGKGGSLATLMKSLKAEQLDTKKDEDGKTIMQAIAAKTAEYTKAIKKLMTEAELLSTQLAEGKRLVLEAKDYEDSSEFTEEFYKMQGEIIDIKAKMKAPRWIAWMKVTDSNFGTDTMTPARSAISSVNSLEKAFTEIDAEFDKAND